MTGGAHDTLRDQLAKAMWTGDHTTPWTLDGAEAENWRNAYRQIADALLPVVRRFAAERVAAERERIAADIEAERAKWRVSGHVARRAVLAEAARIADGPQP